MAFTREDVAKVYVATFNRAPDAAGLDYWVNNSGFTEIDDVAKSFFDSDEAQAIYTDNLTSTQLVQLAYNNLFGREAEPSGLQYWVSELDSGRISQSLMLQALINGALGNDKITIENKTEVGLDFVDAGLDNVELAKEVMLDVTYDPSTVEEAKNIISEDNTSNTETLGTLSNLNTFGVSSLNSGSKWDASLDTITYSFNQSIPSSYYTYEENGDDTVLIKGWTPLNDAQKDTTRDVFNKLETLIDVKFQEVSSDGMIALNLVDMDPNTSGFSFYPGTDYSYQGDMFLSTAFNTQSQNYGLTSGEYGHSTIVHELGHALGLKHPFEASAEAPDTLPADLDDINHSMMSYTSKNSYIPVLSFSGKTINMDYRDLQPDFYSLYDVEALQALYGANTTTNTQDNTYTIKYQDYQIQTLWDAGGIDTIDLSGTIGNSTIDLNSGSLNSADQYSVDQVIKLYQDIALANNKQQYDDWIAQQINMLNNDKNLYTGIDNLGIAQGTVIENLYTGLGDDIVTDNEVNNIINTSAGDDKIYLGNGGDDEVDGGAGNDIIYLNINKDSISSFTSTDTSYILHSDSFRVEFTGIEKVVFEDGSSYTPNALV